MHTYTRTFIMLIVLLGAKAAVMAFAILYAGIGLGPDEAQYWTWSQQPDWGYYSKPPGIAWEIWAGTSLFGSTEFGVRAMPLVLGFILPLLVFALAQRCRLSPLAAFCAAAALALAPLGVLGSILAITDGGMVVAWTAACAYFAGKIEQKQLPNYLLLGVLVLAGALFKWTMYSFWIVVVVAWWFVPALVSWKKFFGGVAISLLALLPSVYWNASHEWATFRHVFTTVTGGHGVPKAGAVIAGNPLDFLGAQAALVSPILFVLLLMAWVYLARNKQMPAGVQFCGWISLALVGGGLIAAFFMKMQGNWLIFAYPTAFVLLAWYVVDHLRQSRWITAGVILSVILCAMIFAIPTVQSQGIFGGFHVPYKISPFRHNVGWEKLGPVLEEAGYSPEKDFLFGDKYQMASILSFYGPEQKRAYFMNLGGARKNQFSFWPGMPKGKTGYFVVVENAPQLDEKVMSERYLEELKPYFQAVRYQGMKPLFSAYGATVKGAFIFKGEGYNGLAPPDPDMY